MEALRFRFELERIRANIELAQSALSIELIDLYESDYEEKKKKNLTKALRSAIDSTDVTLRKIELLLDAMNKETYPERLKYAGYEGNYDYALEVYNEAMECYGRYEEPESSFNTRLKTIIEKIS